MRIAALYDIHGNLPALEAVLAEARRLEVDRVVIGGDVLPGPMPRECLALLRQLDLPLDAIRGNGEAAVLAERAGATAEAAGKVPAALRDAIRWTAGQLSPPDEEQVAGWPPTLEIETPSLGRMLFCHATPASDTDIFTRRTPEARLRPLFSDLDADLVVCGHTHMPFDREIGPVRVVNPGSVGMPFGRTGADWMLLGPNVEHRHTDYDLGAAARRLAGTDYPDAKAFAKRFVLDPPSEEQMLDAFDAASL